MLIDKIKTYVARVNETIFICK